MVSVRQKVIRELRMVQERVSVDDVEAEISLEWCIKMIASNQLNEQDLESSSEVSSSESHSDS